MHNFTEAFVADSGAFMFSYSNVQNVTQKLSIVKPEMARYNNRAKYGPYFGNDTICPSDFDVNPCSLTFNAFTPPNGLPAGAAGSTYLINSTTFYPAEVEVFMLASVPDSQLVDTMSQPGLMRLIQLENTRMKIVHRASKNGFRAYDFHYYVSKVYLEFDHVWWLKCFILERMLIKLNYLGFLIYTPWQYNIIFFMLFLRNRFNIEYFFFR